MGCGAGGVMHYFHAEGKRCFGNDFSEDYLAYGNAKGMQLSYGEMQKHFPEKNTVDLFILAHVYEHLNQPLQVLNDVFSRIRVGGYLLIEVPGVFANISAKKGYPAAYHQFAHVINFFHESYLRALFTHEHLDIVHGDERCTFLVKKTGAISQLFYPDKTDKYKDVKAHLLKNTKRYQSITNPIFVKRKIRNLLG
jgi:SAM-dependent methyltransferase